MVAILNSMRAMVCPKTKKACKSNFNSKNKLHPKKLGCFFVTVCKLKRKEPSVFSTKAIWTLPPHKTKTLFNKKQARFVLKRNEPAKEVSNNGCTVFPKKRKRQTYRSHQKKTQNREFVFDNSTFRWALKGKKTKNQRVQKYSLLLQKGLQRLASRETVRRRRFSEPEVLQCCYRQLIPKQIMKPEFLYYYCTR